MIEIAGITIAYETLGWIIAFVASEVIGASKLKENSVAQLAKGFIDRAKPSRKEDEKVAEVRKAVALLQETLRRVGD
jgi:predicted metal-binding transcription factor (methanogenesis marker protein 9)